jgi:ankyrin repeat protein
MCVRSYGLGAVHMAALRQRDSVLELLLQRGADPALPALPSPALGEPWASRWAQLATPLTMALDGSGGSNTQAGRDRCVQLLLQSGAYPGAVDGSLLLPRLVLMDRDVRWNSLDESKLRPFAPVLMWWARHSQTNDLLHALLAASSTGFDVAACRDVEGYSLLHWVVRDNDSTLAIRKIQAVLAAVSAAAEQQGASAEQAKRAALNEHPPNVWPLLVRAIQCGKNV